MKRYEDADATAAIPYLQDLSPVEIDQEIAALHNEIAKLDHMLDIFQSRVYGWAGRLEYVPATWQDRKSRYVRHGTYEEAVEIVERMWEQEQAWRAADYTEDARPDHFGDHRRNLPYEGPQGTLDQVRRMSDERFQKMARANELAGEFIRRGGWPRYFLVTSSAGHIHSGTSCQTCRPTTTYGWMPKMSGMTEEEAIAHLGRHAESLCSVCFPSAPVAGKRHLTKGQANKMTAAPYVAE